MIAEAPRLTAVLGALLVVGGCVEHRATVAPPSAAPAPAAIDGLEATPAMSEATVRLSALPIELRVTAWHRLEDGTLTRGDRVVATPRRWWQRFPADLFTDLLWPGTLRIASEAELELEPVAETPSEELEAAAIAAGYGGRAAKLTSE